MRHNPLSDNDKHYGPLTISSSDGTSSKYVSLNYNVFGEDGSDLSRYGNSISMNYNNFSARLILPKIVKPIWRKLRPSDEVTGPVFKAVSLSYGFYSFGSSVTFTFGKTLNEFNHLVDRSATFGFPWSVDTFLRYAYYDRDWKLTFEKDVKEEEFFTSSETKFKCLDYDGEEVIATTSIVERVYRRFSGLLKPIGYILPLKRYPALEVKFSTGVGHGKNSWKGGIIGIGIGLDRNENIAEAFKAYCLKHDMEYCGVYWSDE